MNSVFDSTTPPTEHNLISNVLPLETPILESLSFDSCPNGEETSYTTQADLQLITVEATYDADGSTVDHTDLVTMQDSSEYTATQQVKAIFDDFSTKLGLYTVTFIAGFAIESQELV